MTTLNQLPLSHFENMQYETFVPTEEDLERGLFALVYESLHEDGTPDEKSAAHIIPLKGEYHTIHESCWCAPRYTKKDDIVTYEHNMSQ